MKKPRSKKYTPKPCLIGGGLRALLKIEDRAVAASPMCDDQLTDLAGGYMLALTNLAIGNASEESWECVVCAINIGMALAETTFEGQYIDEFVTALDGLFRAKLRSAKTGNFRLDGEALQAVKIAIAVHDEQLKLAHRKEVIAALRTVQKRVAEGNVYTAERSDSKSNTMESA